MSSFLKRTFLSWLWILFLTFPFNVLMSWPQNRIFSDLQQAKNLFFHIRPKWSLKWWYIYIPSMLRNIQKKRENDHDPLQWVHGETSCILWEHSGDGCGKLCYPKCCSSTHTHKKKHEYRKERGHKYLIPPQTNLHSSSFLFSYRKSHSPSTSSGAVVWWRWCIMQQVPSQ